MAFQLDRETVLRYLQTVHNIARLVYSGPGGKLTAERPAAPDLSLEAVWFAVIIPDKPIADMGELAFKDFRYFLITAESLGIHTAGAMFLVFDFDTPPAKTALTFPFIFAEDAEWLDVLVKVKRLSICDGPNGSLMNALTLEFDATGLAPVAAWLDSCRSQPGPAAATGSK